MYVVFIILSIIVALIRKGRFSNIRYFRFSLWYLLILAFILYAGYIVGTIMEIQFVLDYSYWIYFAVYVLIMITVVFNLHNVWSYILVVGVGLNFTATFLNGGKMPILQSALDMARITDNGQFYLSYFGATNQLTITNPYVMSLCKIIGIPLGVTGLPISAGDIIIAISMFFIIQKMMVVPQARKATPQERLAYTDQLKYTSEFNLDEIAKATKESPENLAAPIISSKQASRLGDTQNNLQKNKINDYNNDSLLADDLQSTKKDNIQLAFDDELENFAADLSDDDEFDSFLQKLDNINKKEDEKEVFDTAKEEEIPPQEPDIFDKLVSGPADAEEPVIVQPIMEPEMQPEPEQENENIAKLIDDLQPDINNKQLIEEKISDDDLQLVDDEEIQNIVSELIKNDDTAIDDYDDEELTQQKSDNADEMLNYMLNIFDKHKKAQSAPIELKIDEDEEIISKSIPKIADTENYVSKPKIDLFDDIRNEYDKNQQNESYSAEGVDTTNPFIIENGRIIENPNYKFRKSNEPEPKKKESEIEQEPIIAFDSTQNLEFIRKEIFSELKKQEEAASNSPFKSGQVKNDNITASQAPNIKAENEEFAEGIPSDKNGTKDEYERVEFEIDGKTMYVWIKK